jgi:riboflavin synthase
MFTGLIESQGIITRIDRVAGGAQLEVYAPEFGRDMTIGDSVAVDGACLTVVKFIRGAFVADVSSETLDRTTLGGLRQGSKVNLERALRLSDRLGGHLVSGHVDGVGTFVQRHVSGNSTVYQFRAPAEVMPYLVPKGSVAVDGISLTIAQIRGDSFAVSVVPHTEQSTSLAEKPIGAPVNIEADMMAKYVERLVGVYADRAGGGHASPDAKRGLGDMLGDFADGR